MFLETNIIFSNTQYYFYISIRFKAKPLFFQTKKQFYKLWLKQALINPLKRGAGLSKLLLNSGCA
jgi:hypothetical protein